MTFTAGVSGNPAGPKPRTLSATELQTIENLAARGVRAQDLHRSVFCSRTLFTELMGRQPELSEVIEAGAARFHDSLVAGVCRIATDAGADARVRLDALRFLLSTRFQYRDRGESQINVGIGLSGERGPELTLIQEVLPAGAIATAMSAASKPDPMMGDTDAPRRRPPVDSTATRVEPSLSLSRAWGDEDDQQPRTTVHIRRP